MINDSRMAKLHAFMISTLREQMPKIFKKEKQVDRYLLIILKVGPKKVYELI